MCGRYVLSLRPSQVRHRLADEQNMPVDDLPEDDAVRQTYNFAPGYYGLIYRAQEVGRTPVLDDGTREASEGIDKPSSKMPDRSQASASQTAALDGQVTRETKYKLQAAKWGLIPFWTKRAPDFGSQLRTINCRDDSLVENKGMWNTMKQRKRCIVVAEGFYEWLKKNNGKEKIPHFTKRKDGQLMCFAGLWDMVQYEGSGETLYTYTVITTDSNKKLKFLHDRMPVIMEPGSDAMKEWLDPRNVGWSKELQNMLKPFDGELECYSVDKSVGKVGNNSPTFVIPVDSKDNKNNIANFFGTQKATAKSVAARKEACRREDAIATDKHEDDDRDTTEKAEHTRYDAPAPLSKSKGESEEEPSRCIHKDFAELGEQDVFKPADEQVERGIKRGLSEADGDSIVKAEQSSPRKAIKTEHACPSSAKSTHIKIAEGRSTRSATSNNTAAKTLTKDGNAKITSFFDK